MLHVAVSIKPFAIYSTIDILKWHVHFVIEASPLVTFMIEYEDGMGITRK